MSITQHWTAKVYGVTWAGYKASTEYSFGGHRPTRTQVLAKSGDFQNVTRVELRAVTTTVERVTCR